MPVKTHSPYIVYLCQKVSDNELEEVELCHSDLPKITVICPSVNESCTMKLKQKRTARKSMGREILSINKDLKMAHSSGVGSELLERTNPSDSNAAEITNDLNLESPEIANSGDKPLVQEAPSDSDSPKSSEKIKNPADSSSTSGSEFSWKKAFVVYKEYNSDSEKSSTKHIRPLRSVPDSEGSKIVTMDSSSSKTDESQSHDETEEQGSLQPVAESTVRKLKTTTIPNRELPTESSEHGASSLDGSMQADGSKVPDVDKVVEGRKRGRPKGSMGKVKKTIEKPLGDKPEGSFQRSIGRPKGSFAKSYFEKKNKGAEQEKSSSGSISSLSFSAAADVQRKSVVIVLKHLSKSEMIKYKVKEQLKAYANETTEHHSSNFDASQGANSLLVNEAVEESSNSVIPNAEKKKANLPKTGELQKNIEKWLQTVAVDDTGSSESNIHDKSHTEKQGDANATDHPVKRIGKENAYKRILVSESENSSMDDQRSDPSLKLEKQARSLRKNTKRVSNKQSSLSRKSTHALTREVNYEDKRSSSYHSCNDSESSLRRSQENISIKKKQGQNHLKISKDKSSENVKKRGKKQKVSSLSANHDDSEITTLEKNSSIDKKAPEKRTIMKRISKRLTIPQEEEEVLDPEESGNPDTQAKKITSDRLRNRKGVRYTSADDDNSKAASENSSTLSSTVKKIIKNLTPAGQDGDSTLESEESFGIYKKIRSGEEPKPRGRRKRIRTPSETSENSAGLSSSNQKKSAKLAISSKSLSKQLRDDIQVCKADDNNDISKNRNSDNGSKRVEQRGRKKKIQPLRNSPKSTSQKDSAKTSIAKSKIWSDNDSEPVENISVVDLEDDNDLDVPKKIDSALRVGRRGRKKKIQSASNSKAATENTRLLPVSAKKKNNERLRQPSMQNQREVHDETSVQSNSNSDDSDAKIKSNVLKRRGRKRSAPSVSTESDSKISNKDKIPAKRGRKKKFSASSEEISDAIPITSRGLSSTTKRAPSLSSTEMNSIYLNVTFAGCRTMSVAELFKTYNMCPVVEVERLSSSC